VRSSPYHPSEGVSIRKTTFLAGLCSGAIVAVNWRTLLKKTLIVGMLGEAKLKTSMVRGYETVSDIAHEARWESESRSPTPPRIPYPSFSGTTDTTNNRTRPEGQPQPAA
jgi:hypothetical protein